MLRFAQTGQCLLVTVTYGNDQPTARHELIDERLRRFRGGCGDNDDMIWSMLRQSYAPISNDYMNIFQPQYIQHGARLCGQLRESLDRKDYGGQP